MTDKNDDPNAWFAAQFAANSEDSTAVDDAAPTARNRADDAAAASGESDASQPRSARVAPVTGNDLPLRRPVLPTGAGYTWGLTPGGGPGEDAAPDLPPAGVRPHPVPVPVQSAPLVAKRPFFPETPTAEPVVSEPVVAEPAATPLETPEPTAHPPAAPIPTIEQVLDSPSPRRAAREAAAREAAARESAVVVPPVQPDHASTVATAAPEPLGVVDGSSETTTAEMRALFAGQPDEAQAEATASVANEAARPAAESQPMPAMPAMPAQVEPVPPVFDPNAPLFVDEQAPMSPMSDSKKSRAGKSPRAPKPLKQPKAPRGQAADGGQQEASTQKQPRNQRIVLFVLIGLAVVLVAVVAANFLV